MAQTLKEKLEALKKNQLAPAASTPPAPPAPQQCSCGGQLEGECPECNPAEEADIIDRLKKIGAKVGVNPPPEDAPPSPTCPYCNKEFKHLSRHKCKKQPEGAASPADAVELARKAENGELDTAPAAAEEPPTPAKVHRPDPPPTDGEADFFIALVDVLPLRTTASEMTVFEDIVAPLAAAVAKTNQVPHWKMVDYGKGGGQLARLLEDYLQAKPITGFLICSSGTAEFQACRSVIDYYARNVLVAVK